MVLFFPSELYDVCELLQGELSSLSSGLTSRSVEAKSDFLVTDLNAAEAAISRDGLIKALYGRLFTWLVNRINETIKAKAPRKQRTLGILDLYGYENPDQVESYFSLFFRQFTVSTSVTARNRLDIVIITRTMA